MSSSIVIENLTLKTDVSDLCEIFGKYGRILSASIETDSSLSSLGKGHVSYDTFCSAQNAAKEMNGRNYYGRVVYVKYHESKYKSMCDRSSDSTQSGFYKKIFVKNIDSSWDDYNLIGEFGKFGEIQEAKVAQTDFQSNGYGFVTFQKHSSAKMAVEEMHNKIMNGKELVVQPFTYKDNAKTTTNNSFKKAQEKSFQPNNLYINNLPRDMDDNELQDLFKKFGPILSVRVATNNAHKSKGYGFVCFKDAMVAAEAQKQMNGWSCRSKILKVSFYQKKSDNHPISEVKESEEETYNIFPTDKKTLFHFAAKG